MRWTQRARLDVRASMRTAKSCGSDVAVLALSPREAKLLAGDGGKRAVLRGEHEVSRKAIAQGRPGCSACTCMLVCAFLVRNCTRDRGCSVHPVFPAPSHFERARRSKTRANVSRDREAISTSLRAQRTIHLSARRGMDCFASLAMTWTGRSIRTTARVGHGSADQRWPQTLVLRKPLAKARTIGHRQCIYLKCK